MVSAVNSYRLDRAPVLNWIRDPNRADAG